MRAVLITLGMLGFAAILFSIYVFTVASRRYAQDRLEHPQRPYIVRSGRDRRTETNTVVFPLTLASGEIVAAERRQGERRRAAA